MLLVSAVAIGGMAATVASAQNAGQGPGDGTGPIGPMGPGAAATQNPVSGGPAMMGRGGMHGAVIFNLLDRDGNGSLDADEVAAVTGAIIATIDTDGDGTLTQPEIGALLHGLGERGPRADRGHRGEYGRGEYGRGHPGGRGDMHRGQRDERSGPRSGARDGGQWGEWRRGSDGQFHMRFAERLGIDQDGLTREDFLQRHEDRFNALDTDGDGTITQEEFRAHMSQGPRGRGMR